MWTSRNINYPCTPRKVTTLEIQSRTKNLLRGSMDIFWNHTILRVARVILLSELSGDRYLLHVGCYFSGGGGGPCHYFQVVITFRGGNVTWFLELLEGCWTCHSTFLGRGASLTHGVTTFEILQYYVGTTDAETNFVHAEDIQCMNSWMKFCRAYRCLKISSEVFFDLSWDHNLCRSDRGESDPYTSSCRKNKNNN